MPLTLRGILPLLCLSCALAAGELAPPTEAKFIRIIVFATNGNKVDCTDKELQGELPGAGLVHDPDAKVAWAASEKEVARLSKLGRLVICGNPGWFSAGASLVVTAEGGRPKLLINIKNTGQSGVTLPDSILKLATKADR